MENSWEMRKYNKTERELNYTLLINSHPEKIEEYEILLSRTYNNVINNNRLERVLGNIPILNDRIIEYLKKLSESYKNSMLMDFKTVDLHYMDAKINEFLGKDKLAYNSIESALDLTLPKFLVINKVLWLQYKLHIIGAELYNEYSLFELPDPMGLSLHFNRDTMIKKEGSDIFLFPPNDLKTATIKNITVFSEWDIQNWQPNECFNYLLSKDKLHNTCNYIKIPQEVNEPWLEIEPNVYLFSYGKIPSNLTITCGDNITGIKTKVGMIKLEEDCELNDSLPVYSIAHYKDISIIYLPKEESIIDTLQTQKDLEFEQLKYRVFRESNYKKKLFKQKLKKKVSIARPTVEILKNSTNNKVPPIISSLGAAAAGTALGTAAAGTALGTTATGMIPGTATAGSTALGAAVTKDGETKEVVHATTAKPVEKINKSSTAKTTKVHETTTKKMKKTSREKTEEDSDEMYYEEDEMKIPSNNTSKKVTTLRTTVNTTIRPVTQKPSNPTEKLATSATSQQTYKKFPMPQEKYEREKETEIDKRVGLNDISRINEDIIPEMENTRKGVLTKIKENKGFFDEFYDTMRKAKDIIIYLISTTSLTAFLLGMRMLCKRSREPSASIPMADI